MATAGAEGARCFFSRTRRTSAGELGYQESSRATIAVMLFLIFKYIVAACAVIIVLAYMRTLQVEHGEVSAQFRAGVVPSPLPDGLYKGSVNGYQASWLGKKFDPATQSGINLFSSVDKTLVERYPFATSVGPDKLDPSVAVMRIDYNIPANPFWLRPVLDEIVEVAPGQYLGKLLVRAIPGFPFALTYFRLEK